MNLAESNMIDKETPFIFLKKLDVLDTRRILSSRQLSSSFFAGLVGRNRPPGQRMSIIDRPCRDGQLNKWGTRRAVSGHFPMMRMHIHTSATTAVPPPRTTDVVQRD